MQRRPAVEGIIRAAVNGFPAVVTDGVQNNPILTVAYSHYILRLYTRQPGRRAVRRPDRKFNFINYCVTVFTYVQQLQIPAS